jgi:ubiquinone/menaquinone biosynthesis C-methylase UbiE
MKTHVERQQAQFRRFMSWVKREGGVEGPTLLRTMMKASQRERVAWLAENTDGRILEVGCNWGYVLASVGGDAGLDISPTNVELARLLSPDTPFQLGDATSLPYPDMSFDTVMIPETLEHLDFPWGVQLALSEACRVSRGRVLITVPDGANDSDDATNFKHAWLADAESIESVKGMLSEHTDEVSIERKAGFILIRADKGVGAYASSREDATATKA